MKAHGLVTGIMAAGFLGGCGSDGTGHVEISGKPPAEASALVAHAACNYAARCGTVSVTCSGGGPAGGTTPPTVDCTATVTREELSACYADLQPDIERTLSCPQFTPAVVDMFELCVDATIRQPCLTQAQLDAIAAQAEAGVTTNLDPPECAFLRDLPSPLTCTPAGG